MYYYLYRDLYIYIYNYYFYIYTSFFLEPENLFDLQKKKKRNKQKTDE